MLSGFSISSRRPSSVPPSSRASPGAVCARCRPSSARSWEPRCPRTCARSVSTEHTPIWSRAARSVIPPFDGASTTSADSRRPTSSGSSSSRRRPRAAPEGRPRRPCSGDERRAPADRSTVVDAEEKSSEWNADRSHGGECELKHTLESSNVQQAMPRGARSPQLARAQAVLERAEIYSCFVSA